MRRTNETYTIRVSSPHEGESMTALMQTVEGRVREVLGRAKGRSQPATEVIRLVREIAEDVSQDDVVVAIWGLHERGEIDTFSRTGNSGFVELRQRI